jgi:hypothetical protein
MVTIKGLLCACGLEAEGRCDWPVERFEIVKVEDLRVNDTCTNLTGTRKGVVTAIDVARWSNGNQVFNKRLLAITIRRISQAQKTPSRTRVDTYEWDMAATIKKLRSVECGNPGCYRHIRDLGGQQFVCSKHWQDQLEAIARSANAQSPQALNAGRFERQKQRTGILL